MDAPGSSRWTRPARSSKRGSRTTSVAPLAGRRTGTRVRFCRTGRAPAVDISDGKAPASAALDGAASDDERRARSTWPRCWPVPDREEEMEHRISERFHASVRPTRCARRKGVGSSAPGAPTRATPAQGPVGPLSGRGVRRGGDPPGVPRLHDAPDAHGRRVIGSARGRSGGTRERAVRLTGSTCRSVVVPIDMISSPSRGCRFAVETRDYTKEPTGWSRSPRRDRRGAPGGAQRRRYAMAERRRLLPDYDASYGSASAARRASRRKSARWQLWLEGRRSGGPLGKPGRVPTCQSRRGRGGGSRATVLKADVSGAPGRGGSTGPRGPSP